MQIFSGKIKGGIEGITSANLFLSNQPILEVEVTTSNLSNNQSTIKNCLVSNCEQKHIARGYCQKHYLRFMRHGTVELLPKEPVNKTCSLANCSGRHVAFGYCKKHYRRFKDGTPLDAKLRLEGKTDVERFWNGVEIKSENECWEWTWMKNKQGYGLKRWFGKMELAHRIAFIVSGGVITPERPCVLHSCDNPPCCNPKHLSNGTVLENNQERHRKGRTSNPKEFERNRIVKIIEEMDFDTEVKKELLKRIKR